MSKDQPLVIAIENNQLVIRIGIDTLAYAVEAGDSFQEGEGKVIDKAAFAKDLTFALQEEEEDGTNRVHRLFDDAAIAVVENGSPSVRFSEDE